jgi:hypothetical protein
MEMLYVVPAAWPGVTITLLPRKIMEEVAAVIEVLHEELGDHEEQSAICPVPGCTSSLKVKTILCFVV